MAPVGRVEMKNQEEQANSSKSKANCSKEQANSSKSKANSSQKNENNNIKQDRWPSTLRTRTTPTTKVKLDKHEFRKNHTSPLRRKSRNTTSRTCRTAAGVIVASRQRSPTPRTRSPPRRSRARKSTWTSVFSGMKAKKRA